MNDNLLIAIVVLLGVLVGATVVAILQLRRTLKSAQVFIDTTGRRLHRTLDEVSEAVTRLNRIAVSLEDGALRMRTFFEGSAAFGQSLLRLRGPVRLAAVAGSALGPTLAAALRTLFAGRRRAARDTREARGRGTPGPLGPRPVAAPHDRVS